MGIEEETLDRALKRAQHAEVYLFSAIDTPATFQANRLKLLETRETSGMALRLIKDDRVGFAFTSDLKNPQGLVDSALGVAPFGPRAYLEFPQRQLYAKVDVYDPAVECFPTEDMIHLGQSLIDGVRAPWPDLVCSARISRGVEHVRILNSRGGEAEYRKTLFSLWVEGEMVGEDDILSVWDGNSSSKPITDVKPFQESILKHVEMSRRVVPAPQGEVPVMFTPEGVVGALLFPLLSGFNGKTVLQGASPLGDRLGERLLDSKISLWDDPTLPYVPGSRICDDEGVPSRRLPLVKDGIIASFLYDLQTGAQAGRESTGSASRFMGSPPGPSSSVLIMEGGHVSREDMMASMKEGLVIHSLLGAGQGNVLGGDFSANVLLGFKVQRGQIVGRVKNTMVAGNVYQLLKGRCEVGKTSTWVAGSLQLPDLYFERVSVSAKE